MDVYQQIQKNIYISNITLFIMYIYKFDRHLLHNSWSVTLDSFTKCIDDEKKKNVAMTKIIKKLLDMGKEEAPPIDYLEYTPQHFIKYLFSLRSEKNTRLSIASYAIKRSSLFHLFRLYGFKQSKDESTPFIIIHITLPYSTTNTIANNMPGPDN